MSTPETIQRFPHTTVQCLVAIAKHHRIVINPDQIIDEYALPAKEPTTTLVLRIAADMGLKAKAHTLTWEGLTHQQDVFPILARLENGNAVIVVNATTEGNGKVAILDPLESKAGIFFLEKDAFCQQWKGSVVLLKRQYKLSDPDQPFGFRWFIPEIMKHRGVFRDIALAAVAMQMLALASPLFFQTVIDKVLAHHTTSTLWVLAIGVFAATIFDELFAFLRHYLTLVATNKIDMRITRRAFSHLLSLPLNYFETTSAGVITRHMQQLESIRQFLTGQLFFVALEVFSLIFFIPILFGYSVPLSMIVLAFTAVIAAIIMALLPTFRRRLDALYSAEGQRQALLVETIHGMRTVKALAIEPAQRRTWEELSATAITMHFNLGKFSLIGSSATEFLGKLLPIVIIVIGAQSVFDQTLSVGALIAFQMLSSRVSGPMIQIVGLINAYQQTALSVRMLGEVMNRPPESNVGLGGLRPKIVGNITFSEVTFRYPGSDIPALRRASIHIPAGKVIGIVGRSGSGKTTITRLIQGLYQVQEGVIRFDDVDAREIDLAYLRRQIGIVLQENFLFRGTIRANIAISKPDASFEDIIACAQAAGADEFIERLPQGYDTFLEENAANLSGGQKQRLSIARTLLARPRILILDEAASALDPESEAIFIRNLSKISIGRTVIMISHRLSTLVNAHSIMVMHQGNLVDNGRHEELLVRCDIYQNLWHQQIGRVDS